MVDCRRYEETSSEIPLARSGLTSVKDADHHQRAPPLICRPRTLSTPIDPDIDQAVLHRSACDQWRLLPATFQPAEHDGSAKRDVTR